MDQNYISLSEAAKLTSYSQDYISLLCRQKKMGGMKMGRNWVTTKQWVQEYEEKTKEKSVANCKTKKIKKTEIKKNKISQKKKSSLLISHDSLSAYESQNRFSLFVKVMTVMFIIFFFGMNLLFFQGWSTSLDKRLAGLLRVNQNNAIVPLADKSLLTEKKSKARVAGVKDDIEIHQTENKIKSNRSSLYIIQ